MTIEPETPGTPESADEPAARRTGLLALGVVLALALVIGGAVLIVKLDGQTKAPPTPGSTATATSAPMSIPTDLPDKPGRLVGAEPFTDGVPSGSRAWRILYTTTREDGVPAVSSGLVLVKNDTTASAKARPVIAWAHGTTGIAEKCAASGGQDPARFAAIPALGTALDRGWAIVATDYTGLGTPGPHPYLIGQGEGRAVLDSVRAAHELKQLDLADQTVVWGHSQGGGAALWAAILAPTYAPDAHVIGVAGIAPAADLPGLVQNIGSLPGGSVFASYVLTAYAATYDDVDYDTYVKPAARAPLRELSGLCISDRTSLASLIGNRALMNPFYARDPRTGPLGQRLRENVPSGTIGVPVLIGQGVSDTLVLPSIQAAYVATRCANPANGPLAYRTYAARGHVDIVVPGSGLLPALIGWTTARFAGSPAPSTC